jgi:hypothetical protein
MIVNMWYKIQVTSGHLRRHFGIENPQHNPLIAMHLIIMDTSIPNSWEYTLNTSVYDNKGIYLLLTLCAILDAKFDVILDAIFDAILKTTTFTYILFHILIIFCYFLYPLGHETGEKHVDASLGVIFHSLK